MPVAGSTMVVERVALVGEAAAVHQPIAVRAGISAGLVDAAMIAASVADQLDGRVTKDDVARLAEQRHQAALAAIPTSPAGTQRHA
jgi:2-polyprenyl-6-methoxyphenol hydroxylase-like FAD-dependent oxidoreductase